MEVTLILDYGYLKPYTDNKTDNNTDYTDNKTDYRKFVFCKFSCPINLSHRLETAVLTCIHHIIGSIIITQVAKCKEYRIT